MKVQKIYGADFTSVGSAFTLPVEYVSDDDPTEGFHQKTHTSGWTIRGEVKEDYYTWVNDFIAHHPVYGNLYGDFEVGVIADSEQAFQDFYTNHPPKDWDYEEI